MRLLRLQTFERYYTLDPFNHRFDQNVDEKEIDPLCLVGVNGSGKSNLIELLSEIFCYLERLTIGYVSIKQSAKALRIPFEIEYERVETHGKRQTISIVQRPGDKHPLFTLREAGEEREVIAPKMQFELLPAKILGYSSGLNETIGHPYLQNQSFYSEEVREEAFGSSNSVTSADGKIKGTKTLFLDYDLNASIVLANYLFASPNGLRLFQQRLRVSSVHSFRIDLNWNPKTINQPVHLTQELQDTVSRLKSCALMWSQGSEHHLTMDFIINATTKKAFNSLFRGSSDFLTAMYRLSLLNALSLFGSERDFYRKDRGDAGLVERPPSASAENKVFRVSRLKIELAETKKPIDYADISDGEHQFILIVGAALVFDDRNALFLLDEPETHHNPAWRTRFIDTLNQISKEREQQFIVSTHSPFIVSDCHGKSVFRFQRNGDTCKWGPIDFETYGASFDRILTELFDLDTLISERAMKELETAVKSRSKKTVRAAIGRLGDSYEKRHLYEHAVKLFGKGGRD